MEKECAGPALGNRVRTTLHIEMQVAWNPQAGHRRGMLSRRDAEGEGHGRHKGQPADGEEAVVVWFAG
jgi:hypothetical protein